MIRSLSCTSHIPVLQTLLPVVFFRSVERAYCKKISMFLDCRNKTPCNGFCDYETIIYMYRPLNIPNSPLTILFSVSYQLHSFLPLDQFYTYPP